MTIYEATKATISVKQAAEHYGLNVNRNGIRRSAGPSFPK